MKGQAADWKKVCKTFPKHRICTVNIETTLIAQY
jgi:hypothetical protein